MSSQRVYSDDERVAFVAEVFAGAPILRVSEQRGIPYSTGQEWVAAARSGSAEWAAVPVAKQEIDHVALWANANARAARKIATNLEALPDTGLSPRDLQHIAIVGGISRDAHLDYRDGRTKGGISVDARTVNVQLDASQAAALIAEAQRRGALPAPPQDAPAQADNTSQAT